MWVETLVEQAANSATHYRLAPPPERFADRQPLYRSDRVETEPAQTDSGKILDSRECRNQTQTWLACAPDWVRDSPTLQNSRGEISGPISLDAATGPRPDQSAHHSDDRDSPTVENSRGEILDPDSLSAATRPRLGWFAHETGSKTHPLTVWHDTEESG